MLKILKQMVKAANQSEREYHRNLRRTSHKNKKRKMQELQNKKEIVRQQQQPADENADYHNGGISAVNQTADLSDVILECDAIPPCSK